LFNKKFYRILEKSILEKTPMKLKKTAKHPITRLSISGLSILGGVVASALNGDASGTTLLIFKESLSALASLGIEAIGSLLDDVIKSGASQEEILKNEDLTLAIGKAIFLGFLEQSEKTNDENDKEIFKLIGNCDLSIWQEIVLGLEEETSRVQIDEDTLTELSQDKITQYFNAKEDEIKNLTALENAEEWRNIVERICEKNNRLISVAGAEQVSADLHQNFSQLLRKTLAKDFKENGAAYASMQLRLSGEILHYVKANYQDKQEIKHKLNNLLIRINELQWLNDSKVIKLDNEFWQKSFDLTVEINDWVSETKKRISKIDATQDEHGKKLDTILKALEDQSINNQLNKKNLSAEIDSPNKIKSRWLTNIRRVLKRDYFNKKYISRLYHSRIDAEKKFEDFTNQTDKQVFVITGKAGKGKTNLFCHLVDRFYSFSINSFSINKNDIPILLNGPELNLSEKTIEQYIKDFIEPSEPFSFENLIEVIQQDKNARLIIFIDAVNELEGKDAFKNFNLQMDSLCEKSRTNNYSILFCISCRTDFWDIFKEERWVESEMFDREGGIDSATYDLKNFKIEEIQAIKENYFKWYALTGNLLGDALEQCCDPIMLRYLCEAYTKRGPTDYSPSDKIERVHIDDIHSLRKKEVFDIFVENIRPRLTKSIENLYDLSNLKKEQIYELTTKYLLGMANKMLVLKNSSISDKEIYQIAREIEHPDGELSLSKFKNSKNTIFFTFVHEGIILAKKDKDKYDFVFESYFEYTLGRYIALEKWRGLLKQEKSKAEIRKDIIADFKNLLDEHKELLENNFTNLLSSLSFSILVVEEDELYKDFPYLFIELISELLKKEHRDKQIGLSTIRETKLVNKASNKNDRKTFDSDKKLQQVFKILFKLTQLVDFVIMWDLESSILKLSGINVDLAIEEMKDWAETGQKIQPLYATQILSKLCAKYPKKVDKIIEVFESLSKLQNYKENFWFARPLILGALEIGKNLDQEQIPQLSKLREIIEKFYLENNSNFVQGLALATLPYLSRHQDIYLSKISDWVKKENYVWAVWNLAFELKNWGKFGDCDNDSWIWEIITQLIELNNPHINYAIIATLNELKKFNGEKANELLGKTDLYFNTWKPNQFDPSYDKTKADLIGIIYSPIYLESSLTNHVECRERLEGILEKLISLGEDKFNWVNPDTIEGKYGLLEKVHNKYYDRHFEGGSWGDYPKAVEEAYLNWVKKDENDSQSNPSELRYESYPIALVSAGGAVKAVDYVMASKSRIAWSLGRPPGHLANNKICIFNNIALATQHALDFYKAEKVLIIDCDAHHGMHTNKVFYASKKVVYFSMHIDDAYSNQEGKTTDIGEKDGEGYCFNISYPPKMDDEGYVYIIDKLLIPIITEYNPQFIMISAGFDGHFEDFLTPDCSLTENAYIHLGKEIRKFYERNIDLKIVGVLEGGYGLESMANSFAHLLNEIGGLKIEQNQIGFVSGKETRKIDLNAFGKIKEIIKQRIVLMKNQSKKDSDYELFKDKDYWQSLLN
jgi:acetoin utilization deacetylase AcuC-like enzyme